MKSQFKPLFKSLVLVFDWRKYDTLIIEKLNAELFRRNIKEEHYYFIQEPGSTYIGKIFLSSSSSNDIAQTIFFYFCSSELSISLEKPEVLGSEGTLTNTGWKNGVIYD